MPAKSWEELSCCRNGTMPWLSSMSLSANSTLDISMFGAPPLSLVLALFLSFVEALLVSNCCDNLERSEALDRRVCEVSSNLESGGGGDLSNEVSSNELSREFRLPSNECSVWSFRLRGEGEISSESSLCHSGRPALPEVNCGGIVPPSNEFTSIKSESRAG